MLFGYFSILDTYIELVFGLVRIKVQTMFKGDQTTFSYLINYFILDSEHNWKKDLFTQLRNQQTCTFSKLDLIKGG